MYSLPVGHTKEDIDAYFSQYSQLTKGVKGAKKKDGRNVLSWEQLVAIFATIRTAKEPESFAYYWPTVGDWKTM